MAINLARLGKTVERYMLDTVRIVRPGPRTFHPITLAPTESETLLYEGKAFCSPMGDPQSTTIGEQNVERTQYEIGIPRDAGVIVRPNDIARVTVSANPDLLTATIIIYDTVDGTFYSHIRIKGWHDRVATGPEV